MKIPYALLRAANEPWLMEREKLDAITGVLLHHYIHGKYSAEEIQARTITKTQEREVIKSQGKIAVLPVHGLLMQRLSMMEQVSESGTSTTQLTMDFAALVNDPAYAAIILHVDSEGGTVPGTEEFANKVFDSRGSKPIIAQIDSLAASAAYWIASQADEIVVTDGGRGGSIGVYTVHQDISKALEKEGIKPTIVKAGANKIADNPFGPLSAEAEASMQERVNATMDVFTRAVARGRGVTLAAAKGEQFGEGLVFGARELVDRGMADRVATFEQTLERFGIVADPYVSAKRQEAAANALAGAALAEKLRAGVQPQRRELVNGLKGSLNLTNSEAERAADALLKPADPGDQGAPPVIAASDISAMSSVISGIRQLIPKR